MNEGRPGKTPKERKKILPSIGEITKNYIKKSKCIETILVFLS